MSRSLKVCHVSPTYFAPESFIGGGERFVEELALAMSRCADVKLVSFGPRARRERRSPSYERVILKSWTRHRMTPFSPRLFAEIAGADVVHCHQYFVLPTFLASLAGRLRGSKVFVSDLGGGAWTPGYQIDQSRWITAHLPISRYAAAAGALPGRNRRHAVIYGGVDLTRYPPRDAPGHDGSAVFLGRLLPHKGVHFLVAGLPPGMPLHAIGPAPDAAYLERLRRAAAGKRVDFHIGLDDESVAGRLRSAMALVHPTPVDAAGSPGANELFGLAVIEAMACGCPVVASDVPPLQEIVVDGESGLLVPPNDPRAIGAALARLAADGDLWRHLSAGARMRVTERFTWERVVDRCLEAYATYGRGAA